jgi:hypothetical protein
MDFLATFRLNRPRRLLAVVCQPQHEETVRWGRVYGGLVRSWGRWGGRRESGEAPSPHHYHGPYLGIAEEAGLAAGSNRSVVD